MIDTLQPVGARKRKARPRKAPERNIAADNEKELYRQSVYLSSSEQMQKNWSRVVLRNVKLVTSHADRDACLDWHASEGETSYDDDQLRAIASVAATLSNHVLGEQAFLTVLRALKRWAPSRAQYQTIVATFVRATGGTSFDSFFEDTERESLMRRVKHLDDQGQTDAALDLLYDSVDELMQAGRFPDLDMLIRDIPVATTSVDILLGLLTSTLPARSKLPSRPRFFEAVSSAVRDRGEDEQGLLAGLE